MSAWEDYQDEAAALAMRYGLHPPEGLDPPPAIVRQQTLLQFTLLSLAVQGNQLVPFWMAFNRRADGSVRAGNELENHVMSVQARMGVELNRLVNELWPEVKP